MGQSTDGRHQQYTYYEEKTPRTGVGRLMDWLELARTGWGWLRLARSGWDCLGLAEAVWDWLELAEAG